MGEYKPMGRWQWLRDGWWCRSLSLRKFNEDRREDHEWRDRIIEDQRVADSFARVMRRVCEATTMKITTRNGRIAVVEFDPSDDRNADDAP